MLSRRRLNPWNPGILQPMVTRDPLDDLPSRAEEHVTSDIARHKIKELFCDPFFIVRDEVDSDYGIDLSIEALIDNGKSPTNIRAHIQLKGSGKLPNEDGSFSCGVSRSNLNYLLNCPESLYVFYSSRTEKFYYRNADDVYLQYESSERAWTDQETITVKFNDILTPEAISQFHANLVENAKRSKKLRLGMLKGGLSPGAKFLYGALLADPFLDDANYVFRIDEEGKILFLHNEVWQAAHGPIPRGYQVVHINGNSLDNRRENLDIVKTIQSLFLGEYITEVEAAQAYNIGALICEGPSAELNNVPPPAKHVFANVIESLEAQGWRATEEEMARTRALLVTRLKMDL
jgi:hypothetical protein